MKHTYAEEKRSESTSVLAFMGIDLFCRYDLNNFSNSICTSGT